MQTNAQPSEVPSMPDLSTIPLPGECHPPTPSPPQEEHMEEGEKSSRKRPAPNAYGQWENAVEE